MINYFWVARANPFLLRSDGNLFPRFLGRGGGGGRELPANHSVMSLIRAIGQFHGFSETVVESSLEAGNGCGIFLVKGGGGRGKQEKRSGKLLIGVLFRLAND